MKTSQKWMSTIALMIITVFVNSLVFNGWQIGLIIPVTIQIFLTTYIWMRPNVSKPKVIDQEKR